LRSRAKWLRRCWRNRQKNDTSSWEEIVFYEKYRELASHSCQTKDSWDAWSEFEFWKEIISFFLLWWSILRRYNDIFYWLIDQLYSIRLFFTFDASSLNLWKYCWWKFLIKSSIWTSSTYTHWFSIFDQFNHLTKYCNLFRYNLLFNINFISSCLFSFIMIESDVIISSNRLLNDFNRKTWKTLCIRNV
jgi:hypothetical protein